MRIPRIKIDPAYGARAYHCMSRTVNGERLFGQREREMLCQQIWKSAEYCGVEVVAYAVLSNHFHILVRVPEKSEVSNTEILRRYRALYPEPTKYRIARIQVIEKWLSEGDPRGHEWRKSQLKTMGDISNYIKLVKQRFSRWYNETHERFGTLWSERFCSQVVEEGAAMETVAAYIDLNCVRAGLVTDPKEYRHCSYAAAVAGNARARAGLCSMRGVTWAQMASDYRQTLFGIGANTLHKGASIPTEKLKEVIDENGVLPLRTLLRCRLKFLSHGIALGSEPFVASVLSQKPGMDIVRRLPWQPMRLKGAIEWSGLCVLRPRLN